MIVARIDTAQGDVTGGTLITIEADLSRGLHSFSIVGLAGKAVEEAKDRVNAAIKNSGFAAPKSHNRKLVISLAPADVKKDGTHFDLPIALAYLAAAEEIHIDNKRRAYAGELALDGTIRPVRGVLPIVMTAAEAGITEIVVPKGNAAEAALVEGITVIGADSLREVIDHINPKPDMRRPIAPTPLTAIPDHWRETRVRLEDVRGHASAKRGLLIAAAGRHNVLLVGPPGTGKTMLARAFQGLLPPLSRKDTLTVTAIHSLAGALAEINSEPPFRSPHHTASHTSLVGGGTHPRPGEVTLAHKGVLFCDEFPEFDRRSIDALRQPLEDRVVSISRVSGNALFPADFILIAAMNPYRGSEDGTHDLAAAMLETYKGKISGPILDRIDLWLEVPHVSYETLGATATESGETKQARQLIVAARDRQRDRLCGRGVDTNATMSARDLEDLVPLSEKVRTLLTASATRLNLSPRSYHRVIKVARTIADLDDCNDITEAHLLEALQYRVRL